MLKKYFLIGFALFALAGCAVKTPSTSTPSVTPPPEKAPTSLLTETEARTIAEAICIKGGEALAKGIYIAKTKTWWFDANLNATQAGCNPACVVSETTKTAEIKMRCADTVTKPLPTITDFTSCAQAGNPTIGTYPRTCSVNGKVYTERKPDAPAEKLCAPTQRNTNICTKEYVPVCATIHIQCIKAPCNPVKQTFGNACEACQNSLVPSYTVGACPDTQ